MCLGGVGGNNTVVRLGDVGGLGFGCASSMVVGKGLGTAKGGRTPSERHLLKYKFRHSSSCVSHV